MRMKKLTKIFLCGDVMTGRGIDQVMPYPSDPIIYESYLKNAKKYIEIAEQKNGVIQKPVNYSYIWGDVLDEIKDVNTDVRIINLETSVTTSNDYWKNKGINYRMHPKNIACLSSAHIDFCSLANNHVLDWGYSGLEQTLETLKKEDLKFSGAGLNVEEAEKPAIFRIYDKTRLIVLSFGLQSSGIPYSWQATEDKPGVSLLADLSATTVQEIKSKISKVKLPGDIVDFSIHWGGNWGYEISFDQIDFAHRLIDEAAVDIIHGHSSHHAKAIEVYKGKPVIYGCGDFINDYEGINGHEAFRGDLSLMYFISMDNRLRKLDKFKMTPVQIKNFRVNRASPEDSRWLKEMLNREGRQFNFDVFFTI